MMCNKENLSISITENANESKSLKILAIRYSVLRPNTI